MSKLRDAARYTALREMGCIACSMIGLLAPCGPTEIHHLVDKGTRQHSGGNQATIPLGRWHHRGIPLADHNERYMEAFYGPSMALSKRMFIVRFGTERQLLAQVNDRLKGRS